MNLPVYYDQRNLYNGTFSPSMVHASNTGLANYFFRYLFQKIISVFSWENVPENWSMRYLLYNLYFHGYVCVINNDKFGIVPQFCTLGGYNIYYEPTRVMVVNELIKKQEYKIAQDTELILLTPDYFGIGDMVSFYADMMALTAESAGVNIANAKFTQVFRANNKTQAESFKKMFDNVLRGEPAVFIDKSMYDDNGNPLWETFVNNLSNNYIGDKLLLDLRHWENEFCAECGIRTTNYEKKAQMTVNEVNRNQLENYTRADFWLETINKSLEKVNKMFGLNISVKWREDRTDEDNNPSADPV